MQFSPTDHLAAPARPAHVHAIAGLVGLALAMGVGRFAFTPILPLMQVDAALSVADGAWLAAANYLGYLVGALAALAVKGNAATFIRAALFVTAGATLAMGVADAMPAWLVLRWTAGFGSAFLLVFISGWSLERLSRGAPPLLSAAVFSGVGAGIFGVGVMCLALEAAGVRSAGTWIALGVLSLIASVALWPLFSPTDVSVAGAAPAITSVNEAPTAWWRFVACYGLFGFGYIVPATFLPVMAKGGAGNEWMIDVSWPAFGLAACVSTFLATRMSATGSGLNTWRSAQSIMAVGVMLPAFVSAPPALIAAALCVGGTFMVVTMLGMQTAQRFAGPRARRLMAAMTAAFAAGQLAGPLTVPYLARTEGDFSVALFCAAGALLAGVALLPLTSDAAHAGRAGPLKEMP